jgi:hypothetical protein
MNEVLATLAVGLLYIYHYLLCLIASTWNFVICKLSNLCVYLFDCLDMELCNVLNCCS